MAEMAQQGIGGLNAGNAGFMRPAMGGVSGAEGLREIDIINAYFRSGGISPPQGLQLIKAAVQSGVKFKRIGNTVLGYKPLSQTAMQVYFFSVEPPQIFAKTVEQAIAMLKQGGIRVIYMSKADPMIVQALQTLGVSAQQSDNPKYKVMAAI